MASQSNTTKEKLVDDEEVLQAVILADSFNKRFRPLSAGKPRCLLPICNAPLLDWTLESLALAGVQEVFVICRSHADQVKEAIKESKWSKPGSGMKIVPIMTSKETYSPGDAMRDIYTRGLVTSDFVLVMGDLVSNVRIDEVVRLHKERRKSNKDAIMTIVVKESGAEHRTRARGESSIFVLDSETSECLHYEPVTGFPSTKVAKLPREILAEHPEVEIRNDLIDCSIDICSVEVPSLFQDNFDYLDIRRDFVHGVLTSDLLMKSIHLYVVQEGYAARVQDTRSYESISKDILSRWTFPLVPDDNHPGGHNYEHLRGNRYIAKDGSVVLARTCKIGSNTLIGPSTQVSENVQVISSVIGQNCRIGAGSIIDNSYIFDNTVIGPNCKIQRSIIGSSCMIKENTLVQNGSLIGDGVILGPDVALSPFERLSVKRSIFAHTPVTEDSDEEDSDLEAVEENQEQIRGNFNLGKDSNALVWPRGPPDEEEDIEDVENYNNQRFMRLGDDASDIFSSDAGSETSEEEETSSDDETDSQYDGRSLSVLSDASAPSDIPSFPDDTEKEFQAEVRQSLERAFAEGHSVDNAAVELKTLRMASNVSLTRVRQAVIAAIVEQIPLVDSGAVQQREKIASVVGRWGALIDKIGGVDAVETVGLLQAHCATSSRMPLFGQILAALYQDDIVDEDDIRTWHGLPASKGEDRKPGPETESFKKCWLIASHMIKQFDDQESEEDSEEEGESEDDVTSKPPGTAQQQTPSEDEEESGEEDGAIHTPLQSSALVGEKTESPSPSPAESEEDDEESEE
ncbi:nucleotide-diphospho-sugar transferase [Macrolepiota fuliginosa MF-IS2]|uniref:Translation initiation factor eIF2B subunit epsilon n=1 Tax=Macrolepiota fuliginosa MF-IS2 TaxID=1400762 RepID=A0A9P5XKS8_9AGAR|nr:nucleotide-diphospho-sugar transferase [Macrolepiota fuliginosa MF-IS2]